MREIPEVDDVTIAFPANVVGTLLPLKVDIPKEFPNRVGFEKAAAHWFYDGMKGAAFHPKEGVDPKKAIRVLKACLGSFEPQHEHKMAGVAYLMSEWFEKIDLPEKDEG
jgi:hypothetical protein